MGSRALVVLVLVGACTTPLPPSNGTPDAAAATVDAPTFVYPGDITIRVRNDGTRMLYVQASGWSGQEVTRVLKPGGGAMGSDTCELCNCETCPQCAVCGRGIAQVAAIAPSASLDFTWDQIDWSVIADGCRPSLACEQPALVAPGPLTARAAYSDTFMTTTMYGAEESFIGTAVTAETVFQHPTTDVVVVSIL